MNLKLCITLVWALPACIIFAADNAIVLKANNGQTVTIEHELAKQSDLLKDMHTSGLMGLHNQRDKAENPVMQFEDFNINQLRKMPELLKFAQEHPIAFPTNPTLQERKTYQKNITQIVAEFNKLYLGKGPYTDIFKIAQFFDIPVIIQALGQMKISPNLNLKALERHEYVSSSDKLPIDPEFLDWVRCQLERRMDLEKERYFAGEIGPRDKVDYFKGVSIRDQLAHGKQPTAFNGTLDLMGWNLNSLDGLKEAFDLVNTPIHSINLNHNRLITIPNNSYDIKGVKYISLYGNEIKIPDKIEGWDDLDNLYLVRNKIEVLPNNITGLERLKILNLMGNKLTDIPATTGLDSLEDLNLSFNKLTTISKNIALFKSLKRLNLNDNQITEIPSNITLPDHLEEISLKGNKIREIPEDIQGGSLKKLDLWINPIIQLDAARNLTGASKRKIETLEQNLSSKRARRSQNEKEEKTNIIEY